MKAAIPLVILAFPAVAAPVTGDMMSCINLQAPRIERLQDDLASVGKIVVNVTCVEELKKVAGDLTGLSGVNLPSSLQLERYNAMRETLAFGFEVQATQAAIDAREARLKKR